MTYLRYAAATGKRDRALGKTKGYPDEISGTARSLMGSRTPKLKGLLDALHKYGLSANVRA